MVTILKLIKDTIISLIMLVFALIYPCFIGFLMTGFGSGAIAFLFFVVAGPIVGFNIARKIIDKLDWWLTVSCPLLLRLLIYYFMVVHTAMTALVMYNYGYVYDRIYDM